MAFRKSRIIDRPGRSAALCTITLGALTLGACSSAPEGMVVETGGSRAQAHAGAGGRGAGGGGAGMGSAGTVGIAIAGTGGVAAGGGASGGGGAGGTLTVPAPYLSPEAGLETPLVGWSRGCGPSGADGAPFCDQIVWNGTPARRVLYSWTTAEQAGELRRDRILLTRTETAGLGRGYAFTSLDALAARGTAPENQLLAKLSQELFTKVRYAWTNTWATRMGWPGEDYGDQLLRIVLKPEAWIVMVTDGMGFVVVDLDNNLIPIPDAVAHSERIGAVYFNKKDITGNGSFEACSGGYREFIVGNEAMVEEWSLGTQEIRDQLEADAEMIEQFMSDTRGKPPSVSAETFNQVAVCSWDSSPSTELDGYIHSLAIPSEYYAPLPAELATLADTLRESLFEPDPLTVNPGG